MAALCLELLAKTYVWQADFYCKDVRKHLLALQALKTKPRLKQPQQSDETSSEDEERADFAIFDKDFRLQNYTDETGNPTMARQTIERNNELFVRKLLAETVQDPFFQKQKAGFDSVRSLFLNCAGVGSQVLRPAASC